MYKLIVDDLFCPTLAGVRAPVPRNIEYKILVKGFIVFRFLFSTNKSKEEDFQTLYTLTLLDHFSLALNSEPHLWRHEIYNSSGKLNWLSYSVSFCSVSAMVKKVFKHLKCFNTLWPFWPRP